MRDLVNNIHVEMDEIRPYIVRQPALESHTAARAARVAARNKVTMNTAASTSSVEMTEPSSSSNSNDMEVDRSPASGGGAQDAVAEDIPMVPLVLPSVPVIPENPPTPSFPSALLTLPITTQTEVEPEGWQGAVPPHWVPIIAHDSAQPTGENSPYSDAYISGQPPKRRRLNEEQKPHGRSANIISESLKVNIRLFSTCIYSRSCLTREGQMSNDFWFIRHDFNSWNLMKLSLRGSLY